jgi:endo-alpha-N-acetylgalactosaminidase
VHCYELSDLGRNYIGNVAVQDGKISLDLKHNTPYVIYKKETQATASVEWGEGSLVKDMGFDSKGFIYWKKGPDHDRSAPVTIKTSEQGNAFLSIEGGGDKEAVVSQELTGLEGGKTYAASVWAEVSRDRKAMIGVAEYGGPEVSNYMDQAGIKCTVGSQKRGCFQRMRVIFTMPPDKTDARIFLRADAGPKGGYVHFDDARVVPFTGEAQNEQHFYEDFEQVDEGIYPFIPGHPSTRIHLSERHEGFTEDVLSGNFSLKITSRNPNGLMAQTLPCNLRFQPNSTYNISFSYQVDLPQRYRMLVKSNEGGEESIIMDEMLNCTGDFKHTLVTGDYRDYCIYIFKEGSYGDSHLIIDDLNIKKK